MKYSDLVTCPYFRASIDESGNSFTTTWTVDRTELNLDQVITYNGEAVESISWTRGMRCIYINYAHYGGSVCLDKGAEFTLMLSEVTYTPTLEVGPR